MTTYVRKPFLVDAVEITDKNISELASLVGTLQNKDDGTIYIQVDRRLVPNVFRVYPGFWMTKMDGNIRCYSKQIFDKLFIPSNVELEEWIAQLNAPA